MKILADENLPWPVIQRLMADGHRVSHVGEINLSMSDRDILSHASNDQVVITEDKDFGDLVFRDKYKTNGVVLVRLEGMTLERRAEIVAGVIKEYDARLIGSFTVIGHTGIRWQPLRDEEHRQDSPS